MKTLIRYTHVSWKAWREANYERMLELFKHKDRCYCWHHWSKRLVLPVVSFWCRIRYGHKPQHWMLWKCPCLIWWNYGHWR